MKSAKTIPLTPAELSTYERKIKTPQQLCEILGPLPRKKKAIMCHGTFDLVHPGHIRHLIYAKSKADVLITSLTSDAHIQKANFRPFVPQDLRAMNLAALEVVDYVVIDDNPTPIENIKTIRPDYFAKGYEYSKYPNDQIIKTNICENCQYKHFIGNRVEKFSQISHLITSPSQCSIDKVCGGRNNK